MKEWNPTGSATEADLRLHLEANAIDPDTAVGAGVRVANDVSEVPEELRGGVDLPAIIWPWRGPFGGTSYQAQPPRGTVEEGRPKYKFSKGHANVLNEVRPAKTRGDSIVIVEGTKQQFAVASALDTGYGVYGMGGCWGWKSKGSPVLDLEVANGRSVYVILDADAGSNADVYAAGEALAETLTDTFLASRVEFVQLPGSKNAGADDVLASFPKDMRSEMMNRWVAAAKTKPAKTKPTKKPRSDDAIDLGEVDRPTVKVNGDRLVVIGDLTNALRQYGDKDVLFQQDGVLVRRHQDKLSIVDAVKNMPGIVASAALTYRETDKGTLETWPDAQTMWAVLDRAHQFAPISGISASPFVREDGTIATEEGYDEATKTFVRLSNDMKGIEVPDQPTSSDVEDAVTLLLDDMLVDFPLNGDTPRANALALILTPFIRTHVDIVPLAVVNAHAPGTGKTLFAGLVAELATGREARQGTLNSPEEEIRKNITAGLIEGETFILYDEAHNIDSPQLVEKITSPVVTDRPLGVSKLMRFRNTMTWVACGNNVAVQADMGRRHYRVDMFYEGGDPSLRPSNMYKHANIRGWVKAERRQLVRAALVLVRAWYAAGQPEATDPPKFGSFEQWAGKISGILEFAGVPGFLADMEEARSDNDYTSGTWAEHLYEVFEATSGAWVTAKDVCRLLRTTPDMTPPPIDRLDPTDAQGPRQLGMAYGNKVGRNFGGYQLEKKDVRDRTRGTEYRVFALESGDEPVFSDNSTTSDNFLLPHVPQKQSLLGKNTSISTTGGQKLVVEVVELSQGGSAAPFPNQPTLDFKPDPGHAGVWLARLPVDFVEPVEPLSDRNTRFDKLVRSIAPLKNVCSKHGEVEPHPRGRHTMSCPKCYPIDYADPNPFEV